LSVALYFMVLFSVYCSFTYTVASTISPTLNGYGSGACIVNAVFKYTFGENHSAIGITNSLVISPSSSKYNIAIHLVFVISTYSWSIVTVDILPFHSLDASNRNVYPVLDVSSPSTLNIS